MEMEDLVNLQRVYFKTGATIDVNNRISNLRLLRSLLINEEKTLCEAVYKDLRRKPKMTSIYEVGSIITEIDYMIDNIHNWSAPENAQKTLVTALDKPQIIRQPKGVVLIIGPWNYPINTLIMPLVAVMAAGNTAVLKPSEVAAHTAKAFETIISKAFDKVIISIKLNYF